MAPSPVQSEARPEVQSEVSPGVPLRMAALRSVLVLVDYQERLMPAIADAPGVLARARLLGAAARELGVPVVGTAQRPDRMGPNLPEIAALCDAMLDKMHFGACDAGLVAELERAGAAGRDVVIAGCEAHVCLLQTALGLLEAGRRVWVVEDASGSRRPGDHAAAMRRLAAAGAGVVTAEMVAFEWLNTCENAAFRAVSGLVKDVPVG